MGEACRSLSGCVSGGEARVNLTSHQREAGLGWTRWPGPCSPLHEIKLLRSHSCISKPLWPAAFIGEMVCYQDRGERVWLLSIHLFLFDTISPIRLSALDWVDLLDWLNLHDWDDCVINWTALTESTDREDKVTGNINWRKRLSHSRLVLFFTDLGYWSATHMQAY